MMPRGYAAYQVAATTSIQSKEKLLLMAYEGAIRFGQAAQEGIRLKSPKMRGEAISKIMAIITELDLALDREVGGEIAENLSALYQWTMRRLTEANLHNDIQALAEVHMVLTTLKEGFEGAINQQLEPINSTEQAATPAPAMGGLSFAV
jgi:flagellar protein FliS